MSRKGRPQSADLVPRARRNRAVHLQARPLPEPAVSGKHGRRRLGRTDETAGVTTATTRPTHGEAGDEPLVGVPDAKPDAAPAWCRPAASVPEFRLPPPPTPPSLPPIRTAPLPEYAQQMSPPEQVAVAVAEPVVEAAPALVVEAPAPAPVVEAPPRGRRPCSGGGGPRLRGRSAAPAAQAAPLWPVVEAVPPARFADESSAADAEDRGGRTAAGPCPRWRPRRTSRYCRASGSAAGARSARRRPTAAASGCSRSSAGVVVVVLAGLVGDRQRPGLDSKKAAPSHPPAAPSRRC